MPVNDPTAPSTRLRILATARQLFGERGYQDTSLRQIAERLDLTKTAVLYHFATKAHLIEALADPLLNDLARALDEAVSDDFETARWQVCSGLLDVYLAHRESLQLLLRDLALLGRAPMFDRFVKLASEANRRVAGPRPDLAARVRAAQAIAMLSDPVILLADAPTAALRRQVLAGLARLFGEPPDGVHAAVGGVDAADGGAGHVKHAPRRRGAGRPAAMSRELVAAARRLRSDGKHTMAQIAAQLGVSRATLYRYF